MGSATVTCANCGKAVPEDARYCPHCGEAVAPQLVAELRRLHGDIQVLDRLLAEGHGEQRVVDARGTLLNRYMTLRRAPEEMSAPAANTEEPTTASTAPPMALVAGGAGRIVPPSAPVAPVAPRGPAFSWRAFVAEQAIAIMAYLGGFLLLVATLSFEVGGWQALGNGPKLVVVCIVYAAFGALGFALRRSTQLRTVARAYLGVFALMTPLVALAVYRFELQSLGFPVAGMLCVSAAYAAAIYLLLAARTGFTTYAYLGWVAFVVSALSIALWLDVSQLWELTALSLSAITLLAVRDLPRMQTLHAVNEAAEQLAPVAALIAITGTELLGYSLWRGSSEIGISLELAPFIWAAFTLVPLTLLWSRRLHRRNPPASSDVLDIVDWNLAAFSAQAILAIAAWKSVSHETSALVLAGLALGMLLVAMALLRRLPERRRLRWWIEALGLVFPLVGAWRIQTDAPPNGPLIVCLSVAALLCAVIAFAESATWMLVAAGILLSLDYRATLVALLPQTTATTTPFALDETLIIYFTVFAMALWAFGLLAGAWPRTRPYSGAIFAMALANALYVTTYLNGQDALLQTSALSAFALAALIAGWRERQSVVGGIATAFFGLLAVTPFGSSVDGAQVAATMLIAGVAALAARQFLGRDYAAPLYAVAGWAAIWGGLHLGESGETTTAWSWLGVSFAAWTLFTVAALATIAAVRERQPAAMIVPAGLALWAVYTTFAAATDGNGALGVFTLTLALAGAGMLARALRGQWWGTAWHAAAALASLLSALSLTSGIPHAGQWRVAELLIFAGVAVLIATQVGAPAMGMIAVGYSLSAAWLLPGPANLVPTLVMVFAAAGLGMALRVSRGGRLAFAIYALYATAAGASLLAVDRVPGRDPGMTEALLLVFGATAYVIAALERRPVVGFAPVSYIVWATLRQPDAHALLPIALGLAVLGIALGRVGGLRWAWPAYIAATVAGAYGALLGRGDVGFEPYALAALALTSYVIAAVEARPELLPLPMALSGLALATGPNLHSLPQWSGVLAFAGLGWVYYALGLLWRRLPLPQRDPSIPSALDLPNLPERWRDAQIAGIEIQAWAGLLVGAVAALAAMLSPEGFTPGDPATWAAVGALISLVALLAFHAYVSKRRVALYASGAAMTLAVSWTARALGAENVQAFILAPGSYLLLVGALLPVDERAGGLRRAAPLASLIGAGLLLLPTLGQSFASESDAIYALILALEALIIVGVGVGTQSRLLVLAGSAFVGAAALRGAILAVTSGIPVPLVIGGLAALLLGGATALSLRARRESEHTEAKPADAEM